MGLWLFAFILLFSVISPMAGFAENLQDVSKSSWVSTGVSTAAKENVVGQLRTVNPSNTPIHTYRFYRSVQEATAAQNNAPIADPFDEQRIGMHGRVHNTGIVEIKGKIFDGWYYLEDGAEHAVQFDTDQYVEKSKIRFCYPKYKDVNTAFFVYGNTIRKVVEADAQHHVSRADSPNVTVKNKALTGWSIEDPKVTTVDGTDPSKIFHFSEDNNPTEVKGSVILYAIMEEARLISFDSMGGSKIEGVYLGKNEYRVKAPDNPTRAGYSFDHWYIVQQQDDGNGGTRPVNVPLTVGPDGYFTNEFKNATTVFAAWNPQTVPFNVIFMREKVKWDKPEDKYEFVGSFSNPSTSSSYDPNLVTTEGLSDSVVSVGPDDPSADPTQKTILSQSKLSDPQNYENILGLPAHSMEGFHLNVDESNKYKGTVDGGGNTVKIVYYDRDEVYIEIRNAQGALLGSGGSPQSASYDPKLGGLKYGQSLLRPVDMDGTTVSLWDYVQNGKAKTPTFADQRYMEVSKDKMTYVRVSSKSSKGYSLAPSLNHFTDQNRKTESLEKMPDGRWRMPLVQGRLSDRQSKVYPVTIRTDGLNLQSLDGFMAWIADPNTSLDMIKERVVPEGTATPVTEIGGYPSNVYLGGEDYVEREGYSYNKTVMPDSYRELSQGTQYQGALQKMTQFLKQYSKYDMQLSGNITNKLVSPIAYDRHQWTVAFNSNDGKGPLEVKDVPYDAQLVGGETAYRKNPKENDINQILSSYTAAQFDPKTKELTNGDKVTWNPQDPAKVFMGWYLDPAFSVPFDTKMKMPDHSVQVFAKWDYVYHYVRVHKYAQNSPMTNIAGNILEIKVRHGERISSTNPAFSEYVLPQGYTTDDFEGWEAYGNQQTKVPSRDGSGAAFSYNYDWAVDRSFDLYPSWLDKRARVVYLYNYSDNMKQPITEDQYADLDKHLNDSSDYSVDNVLYMSQFQYNIDTKLRLRAPLGFESTPGSNGEKFVKHPTPPQGSAAYGKQFVGWRLYTRDYQTLKWSESSPDLYLFNSIFQITKNSVSYSASASADDALGAVFFVAEWREKNPKCDLTLHSNYDSDETVKINDIEVNQKLQLPSAAELVADGHQSFNRAGYQLLGWNTKPDGSGIQFKNADEVLVDDQFAQQTNHLYAQWQKFYTITASKVWLKTPKDFKQPRVGIGLMRRTAAGPTTNPDWSNTQGFEPVPNSIKYVPDDLNSDGVLTWSVEGHDPQGKRYAYVTLEVNPGEEAAFYNNKLTWKDRNVSVTQPSRIKEQFIKFSDVDACTSATVRANRDERYDPKKDVASGYDFVMSNTYIEVPQTRVDVIRDGDKSFTFIPPDDSTVKEIVFDLPTANGGRKTLTLAKQDDGTWKPDDGSYTLGSPDDAGRIRMTLPGDQSFKTGELVRAKSVNIDYTQYGADKKVSSQWSDRTVLALDQSATPEKPEQGKKDNGKIVVTVPVPQPEPAAGTVYELTDDQGNPIKDPSGKTYTGYVNSDGKVVFEVPEADKKLKNGDKVQVKVTEPNKYPSFSKPSDPLDLNAPVITAPNVTEKKDNAIADGKYHITSNELAKITSVDGLPDDLSIRKDGASDSEEYLNNWKIAGTGRYTVKDKTVTLVAEDRFGNIAQATFMVTITDKDVVGTPVIDQPQPGDTTIKVTPPSTGDRLLVTMSDGKQITLEKQSDGSWKDPATGKTYTSEGGKLVIALDKPAAPGDFITAQGKDSAGKLEDSPRAEVSVRPSSKVTPAPVLDDLTMGDKTFRIKPVNNEAEGITPDRLVVTFRDSVNADKGRVVLTKSTDGSWTDGSKTYTVGSDGYLIVDIPSSALPLERTYTLAATAEDVLHNSKISDPTSAYVKVAKSAQPTAEQGKNDKDGNPVITGKGTPGASIEVKDNDGNVIAGPVTVKDDGTYEITVPKDKIPADTTSVKVIQTEKDKDPSDPAPEPHPADPSHPKNHTPIDLSAPKVPVLDPPTAGDKTVALTPDKSNEPGDKLIITLPNGEKITVVKQPDGSWKNPDNNKTYTPDKDGKIYPDLPPNTVMPDTGEVVVTTEDPYGNTDKTEQPIQPLDKTPPAKPGLDKPIAGDNRVTLKPDPSNKPGDSLIVTLPNGDTITVVKQPDGSWKNPNNGATYIPDTDGKITIPLAPGTKLPDTGNVEVVAKDPKGNTSEKVSEPIIPKDVTPPVVPTIVSPHPGDTTVTIIPDKSNEPGDTLIVTVPNGGPITIVKQPDGTWKDSGGKTYTPDKDGKVTLPLPPGTKLPDSGDVVVEAKDPSGNSDKVKEPIKPADKTAPGAPQFDQPVEGDRVLIVTPPQEPDTVEMKIKLPDGTDYIIKKSPETGWYDPTAKDHYVDGGKVVIRLPKPVVEGDKFTGTATDGSGNESKQSETTAVGRLQILVDTVRHDKGQAPTSEQILKAVQVSHVPAGMTEPTKEMLSKSDDEAVVRIKGKFGAEMRTWDVHVKFYENRADGVVNDNYDAQSNGIILDVRAKEPTELSATQIQDLTRLMGPGKVNSNHVAKDIKVDKDALAKVNEHIKEISKAIAVGAHMPEESWYVPVTYTVESKVADGSTNTGKKPADLTYTVLTPILLIPEKVDAAVALTKSVDKPEAAPGEKVTYTFTVVNNGKVDLKDMRITDEMLGLKDQQVSGDKTKLVPGESVTYTATYTIPSDAAVDSKIKNKATASAESFGSSDGSAKGEKVSSNVAEATVTVKKPSEPTPGPGGGDGGTEPNPGTQPGGGEKPSPAPDPGTQPGGGYDIPSPDLTPPGVGNLTPGSNGQPGNNDGNGASGQGGASMSSAQPGAQKKLTYEKHYIPKTSDTQTHYLAVAGVALLLAGLGVGLSLKRRKERA